MTQQTRVVVGRSDVCSEGTMSPGARAFGTPWRTMAERLDHSVLAELRPIIDAIVASRRVAPPLPRPDVAVTLPATKGRMLVVSLRAAEPPAQRRPESAVRGLDARQLRRITATIHDQISEPISVTLLSSIVGLSRSYFSHAFRIAVGETPHAHVVRLRIERAMKLMIETDAPLGDIALAAGFSDQAHLCHVFRRSAGVTPARWRKTRRNDRGGSSSNSQTQTLMSSVV